MVEIAKVLAAATLAKKNGLFENLKSGTKRPTF